MSAASYWDDQTFWATPIVYDAADEFGLDILIRVEFCDYLGRGNLACAWVDLDRTGTVSLAKWWWVRLTEEERRETLLHEAAHVISLAIHGEPRGKSGQWPGGYWLWPPHGWDWQETMRRLGQSPSRHYLGTAKARTPNF